MFNGRGERENVSFHSSNTHTSSLSLFLCLKGKKNPRKKTHTCTRKTLSLTSRTRTHLLRLRKSTTTSDMRGITGKWVFSGERTGQHDCWAVRKTQPLPSQRNFKAQRETTAVVTFHLWWRGVVSARGSKWDDSSSPFVRGVKRSCCALPGDRWSYAAFGVDQSNPSCCLVEARGQNCSAILQC